MRKKTSFILIACLVINLWLVVEHVYAQDATPSSTFQQKLEELKKEVASKAAAFKKEVDKKLQNKFYLGSLISKESDKLQIQTSKGVKSISINEFTVYKTRSKGEGTLKDLSKDDYVAVLGDIDDKNNLNAKRVVRLTAQEIASNSAKFIWGEVQSISGNSLKLTNKQGEIETINLSASTLYRMGQTEVNIGEIKNGKTVIVVATENKAKSLDAKFVYVTVAELFRNKLVVSASPSATPKASASARPRR